MKTLITYPIVETFHSLQGEGYWSGVSAFFIRLAGCDVHCPWCDQKESWSQSRHPAVTVPELTAQVSAARSAIVIITGGEPLLHDLNPLTESLRQQGLRVHLETSGAHPFSGNFDWVTFSPKIFKLPHPSIYEQVSELKIVVASPADLEWGEAQAALVPPQTLKYLQPEWSSPHSQELIYQYILNNPQWRLSLQTHKFLGVR